MFGIHDLALFVASGLLLNIAPGPDSLLVMTRGASQGWRAGSAAALGIGAGTIVHVLAAALGLSALLAASGAAFAVLRYAGAAYLVFIGIAMLRGGGQGGAAPEAPAPSRRLSHRRIFVQGFLSNVLNPKVAIFFLAFVPQFIDPQAPDKALAFMLLGGIFSLGGVLWCHVLAVAAALAGRRVRAGATVLRWLNRLTGALFVALGVRLAWAGRG